MLVQTGFYVEPGERYRQLDDLSVARERAVSSIFAVINSRHPHVLPLESPALSPVDFSEALFSYAQQVGSSGRHQVQDVFEEGAADTNPIPELNGLIHAIDNEELSLRQETYAAVFKPLGRRRQLTQDYPTRALHGFETKLSRMLASGYGGSPRVHHLGDIASRVLVTNTLLQMRDENNHLGTVADSRPNLLGRWAAGNLLQSH